MKKKGELYCCCNKAYDGCIQFCDKGIALDPDYIVHYKNCPRRKLKYDKTTHNR